MAAGVQLQFHCLLERMHLWHLDGYGRTRDGMELCLMFLRMQGLVRFPDATMNGEAMAAVHQSMSGGLCKYVRR